MASPLGPPGVASVFARLVVVIGTIVAFHVCMSRPNPPPSSHNRKQVSDLENATQKLLQPFAVCFSLAPGIAELAATLIRLVAPHSYDVISGTCAERVSFSTLALFGFLLSLCGMGIRLWCYRALGRLFTFELALLPDHKLITSGPYAFVRHPAYTGGLLTLVGMTMTNTSKGSWAYECGLVVSWWGMGWGSFLAVTTLILIERCSREDKLLRGAFGEEWDAWRERVRWRMIPCVY